MRAHHVLHRNGAMTDSIPPIDGKTFDNTCAPLEPRQKYSTAQSPFPDFELPVEQGNPFYQGEKPSDRHCKEEEEEGLSPNQWVASGEQEDNSGSYSEAENVEMSTWRGSPSVKGSTETMRMLLLTCVSVGITLVHVKNKEKKKKN